MKRRAVTLAGPGRWVVACLFLAGFAGARSGWGMDREAVRRWVTVPVPRWEFAVGWSSSRGFVLNDPYRPEGWAEKDRERRRRELESSLTREPTNPALWLKLAEVESEGGRTNGVARARAEAERLVRSPLDAQPGNAELQVLLARALPHDTGFDEAERLLLDATRRAPDDDRTWRALSELQVRGCFRELGEMEEPLVDLGSDLEALAKHARAWLERAKPGAERIAAARERIRKAGEAADRAARVPKPSMEALMIRWTFRSTLEPMLWAILGQAPGSGPAAAEPGAFVEELRRASLMATNEPYGMCLGAGTVMTLKLAALEDPTLEPTRQDLRPKFPASDLDYFAVIDRRLEGLTRVESGSVASAACLSLGFLRVMLAGDRTNAAVLAEKAADLDPDNTASLPMAISCWSSGDRQDRALVMADRWVRTWDRPISRAFRAKVRARAGRLDDAVADLRWILDRQGTNAMARIGLAAVESLRPEPERIREAAAMLRALDESGVAGGDEDLARECRLLRAAAVALSGDVPGARRLVFGVLAGSPEHQDARRLLDAINHE